MATRARIGKKNQDGTVTSIYCHFDGNPEHMLPILSTHFDTEEKIDALLAAGDIWGLSPDLAKNKLNWRGTMEGEAITRRLYMQPYIYFYIWSGEWSHSYDPR